MPCSDVSTSSSPPMSTSDSTNYAFLVHSLDTIPRNLPPDVDNKPLARQRRKRTSPEDQTILEEEYQRDSKPDKSVRLRIVQRVALGEKEVQIWFQNRRQATRRKSQPIRTEESRENIRVLDFGQTARHDENSRAAETLPTAPIDEAQVSDFVPRSSEDQPNSSQLGSIKSTASGVRLSFTAQGSAKILQGDEASPTPPSSPSKPVDALQSTMSSSSQTREASKPCHLPIGRSRDSRAWEFWCDDESRNGLVRQANQESTGSAADAINIMRSKRRKTLAPVTDRHLISSSSRNLKRPNILRHDSSRPTKLIRRLSANDGDVRWRSKGFAFFEDGPKCQANVQKHRRQCLHSSDGDSDKENHDPNKSAAIRSTTCQFAEQKSCRRRPALSYSHTAPNYPHLRNAPNHVKPRMSIISSQSKHQSCDPEKDDELASFMRGAAATRKSPPNNSAEGEDDLHCIQGLLSLSQGNWR